MTQWTNRAEVQRVSDRLTAVLSRGYLTSPDPESGAMDLAALKQGVEELGEEGAAELLLRVAQDLDVIIWMYSPDTRESYRAHAETVLAVMGRQRQHITRRFGNNAQAAIRAFGAFPLAEGETAADRYRQLCWSAKQASRFGTERRANQLVCVRAAMEHLAQVAGYPDAARMEFALDADLASEATDQAVCWEVGDYRLSLDFDGSQAVVVVERGGRRLKAAPKAVRADPAYARARELQEQLRGQARRLRSGLLESLVSQGTPISSAEVVALLRLPAGRAMLPALAWRTSEGVTGFLEDAGEGGLRLRGLDGVAVSVVGDLHAAHPWDLWRAGTLEAWQRAVEGRRIVQPVPQVLRELYLLTPAEAGSATYSLRFAGIRVGGAQANRLLATRAWRVRQSHYEAVASRRFGDVEARFAFEETGSHLAETQALTGRLCFCAGARAIPLAQVPARVVSEAMRDVDLVVSVAALAES